MGGFILGAAIALFIGMRLARLIDGNKGARAGYKKAKGTDLAGARKKANGAFFALMRFAFLLILVLAAVLYGWISANAA
ncbi:hypothetical protein ACQP2E_15455 [Actinoplanes sp. CA-015351]|uniref:hypothetical protein n=1 Tax=Actinoplanes sp. CA-015351 TaxID=3239897 RepID=UPI003D994231